MRWMVEVGQECHNLETKPIKRRYRIINIQTAHKSNKISKNPIFTKIHISA